ncbi:hypothetical protein A0H81_09679 [Grifola frondosa]|uniref:TRP C-terminal domain-containing protein n=1 Tax=Grifola frondosa TaxID=5627 RepID=A0A1C7M0J5_GRIFR|nr:hypothetical protein A0H81_09679 [Grifola frondosa]
MACSNGLKPCSALLRLLLILGLSLSLLTYTVAQPATVQFEDCFSGDNSSVKLEVSNVYAQFFGNGPNGPYINFTVLGQTPLAIEPSSNGDNPVATTLFTTTEILTFQQWVNNSNSFFSGPFAFSTSIQLLSGYELLTYDTRLRALDPFQNELLCLDLNTTTLKPGAVDSVYGHAHAIFWATVGLAIGYWLVVGLARLVSAWGRGSTRSGSGLWSRVESAGFILASALSGERFASSPALMRFCTPSLRDVMFHTQWCAALSMVAVQWPAFAYPLLSQTAWATLSYNISITQGTDASQDHWNPLTVAPYQPPSNFADQLNDSSSAIFAFSHLLALSFAILSVLIPIFLILRLTFTNTTKLYDETWTLLSLGPLYNHYRHGSQLFAKKRNSPSHYHPRHRSGSALGTSIWLPWGQGASMGLISFLFCVARIVIAVLLVILTPVVSIGSGAAQWVAYAILFILGLVYLAFCLMLLVKIVEGDAPNLRGHWL